MADGKGCTCNAVCDSECCCGADWTPQEVYDLRAEVVSLRGELSAISHELNKLRTTIDTRLYPNHGMAVAWTEKS